MENDNSWISVHRKFKNWQWYKDINVKTIFLHLLLSANFKDGYWKENLIKRGQYLTSIKNLADETGVSVRQARTALSKLKSTGEITIKTTNKYSLVTVEKYDLYQKNNVKATSEMTNKLTNERQAKIEKVTTNNKNINNKNNNIYIYFINKYKEKNLIRFNEKMKFLREIKQDEKYKELSEEDEYRLINYVMGRGA